MIKITFYKMKNKKEHKKKISDPEAWVVDVNMGYGHQRTAFPLRDLAPAKKVISANDYKKIPKKDRRIWERSRKFYEFLSRFKRIPIIGSFIWNIFDRFQEVLRFYPKRDLSKPNVSLKVIFSAIKNGWGKHLISNLEKKPLSLITTFFTPAFMAEIFNYPQEIYCVVCDADIARTWVPLNPQKSKIKYLAPCSWVVSRLKLYGVKKENIFLTGYPLPKENLGSENLEVLKQDLRHRLFNLDPKREYCLPYKPLIENYLGKLPSKSNHPLTLMFAVGGAGAQADLGVQVINSLRKKIKEDKMKMILVAGVRKEIKDYFLKNIKKLGLRSKLGKNIEIIYKEKIYDYFEEFNKKLRKTDILWTKPSELSFYSALGIPIIIAPSMGSHEHFNKRWLLRVGSAFGQGNPAYADQWLFDLIEGGRLAEAAIQGFLEIENLGTYNIEKILREKI